MFELCRVREFPAKSRLPAAGNERDRLTIVTRRRSSCIRDRLFPICDVVYVYGLGVELRAARRNLVVLGWQYISKYRFSARLPFFLSIIYFHF